VPLCHHTPAMRAFLDDAPLSTEHPTLAAALRAGAARACQSGRIVVEVYIDGQMATEAAIDQPSNEPTTSEVRLISVDPRELVHQTLLDCIEALDAANAEQLRCAALVQAGKIEEALEPLSQAIGTWQAVRDAVERSTSLVLGREPGDIQDLRPLLDDLSVQLEAIRSALAREDWSALADTLAYDMPEQVDAWSAALTGLAERLK
jgi:hypothetical protein